MESNETLSTPLVIFVDVDDTYVRTYGSKRIPMPAVIEHIRALHTEGVDLYCWSAGGGEYARESAYEFGIGDCFRAFLPKPNVLIDDQALRDWRLLHVYPGADVTATAEDFRDKLKSL